jgi:stage III sporulation protein AD
MTLYLQICGGVFLSVILFVTLKNSGKDLSAVLTVAVCSMVALTAMHYLKPIIAFVKTLESIGGLNRDMVTILLKATGIGIVSEISNLVCKDAGNESMGKSMQILGTAVILYLSIPLFSELLELMQKILGEL